MSEDITPIDPWPTRVGFSYGLGLSGLMSKLILFFTRAPCSHTWLLYYDHDFKRDMVMEAHLTWQLIPYELFKKKNHIVAIYVPKMPIDSGLEYASSLLSTRYDVEGLFGNLVVLFGEWIKRKWKNPFRSKRMVFCSEGVGRTMAAVRYPGSEAFDLDAVRPEHILKLFQTDGSNLWPPSGPS